MNAQETTTLLSQHKYKEFNSWAKRNGVIAPKVSFPSVFNDGLVGMSANEKIEVGEAFVYVPGRLLITVLKAFDSEIGYVFESYEEVFKSHFDSEYLTLTVYSMFEYNKKEGGFWWPYF